ncbi:DUF3817 domain-containing protein [Azohydromonas lata]|uniref:DUF3817 domain-containing protein n=1 Tax=Azohydromonas lata TaxID=45677 RepID=A0ABU5IMF9_9BURK|nr:DUF3817 domain-containing protein [Azohydromonas lata]MDZ5460080.1 DUF3817 domain-containing protein [Azohydromonas lata]
MLSDHLRHLRRCALAESVTLLLLLCVAVPLKHAAGWPWGVNVMGPLHGLAFVLYGWRLLVTATYAGWPVTLTLRLAAAAFLPLGGWLVHRYVLRARTTLLALSA